MSDLALHLDASRDPFEAHLPIQQRRFLGLIRSEALTDLPTLREWRDDPDFPPAALYQPLFHDYRVLCWQHGGTWVQEWLYREVCGEIEARRALAERDDDDAWEQANEDQCRYGERARPDLALPCGCVVRREYYGFIYRNPESLCAKARRLDALAAPDIGETAANAGEVLQIHFRHQWARKSREAAP